ncbi:MAG: D-amino-acid transaminase [Rickettsiales bacterium]|nr:D-amino-acid transaminase [Rickettsiales bacterium]
MQIIFLNNQFLPLKEARVSPLDRGYLFADGVYEVSAVINGKLVDNKGHLERLKKSLVSLDIPLPKPIEEIEKIQLELIQKNNIQEGLIYLQITRGEAPERDFNYPDSPALKPVLLMFTQEKSIINNPKLRAGVKVITTPDLRWERRDIKSIALLAQVMAKNIARKQGAFEAVMYDKEGFVTEGSSSNIFIIKNKKIITKNLSNQILHGITRKAILEIATQEKIEIEERAFSIEELYQADEAFMTSATAFVTGIIEVDGKPLGNSQTGEITQKLFQKYISII